MMIEDLLNASYPAIVIERWTGVTGWPCFRVSLLTAPNDDPIGDGREYETYRAAHNAAEQFGAEMLPGRFHVLDLSTDGPCG